VTLREWERARGAISTIVPAQNFRLVLKSEEKEPADDSVNE
jgi:hypothetical protein